MCILPRLVVSFPMPMLVRASDGKVLFPSLFLTPPSSLFVTNGPALHRQGEKTHQQRVGVWVGWKAKKQTQARCGGEGVETRLCKSRSRAASGRMAVVLACVGISDSSGRAEDCAKGRTTEAPWECFGEGFVMPRCRHAERPPLDTSPDCSAAPHLRRTSRASRGMCVLR